MLLGELSRKVNELCEKEKTKNANYDSDETDTAPPTDSDSSPDEDFYAQRHRDEEEEQQVEEQQLHVEEQHQEEERRVESNDGRSFGGDNDVEMIEFEEPDCFDGLDLTLGTKYIEDTYHTRTTYILYT